MQLYIWLPIVALAAAILLALISAYNTLVKARNRVTTQWAQIDVQLTRRAELIPNLVECVRGYAKHESETLNQVIRARSALAGADTPQKALAANAQISAALPSIFALSEAYPALKADGNFLSLQSQLTDTENKIAYARQFYNDSVLIFKNLAEAFPRSIVAGIFGFKPQNFYAAEDTHRQNVQVKF